MSVRLKTGWRSPRRVRLATLAMLCCALMGGWCVALREAKAAPVGQGAAVSTAAAPEHVFAFGYARIAEVYLNPVEIGRLAQDGLRGLKRLDPQLDLEFAAGKVRLLQEQRIAAELPLPAGPGAGEWAALTLRVIERSRSISNPVREAGWEEIYQAVFDAIMVTLDPYSRYSSAARAYSERSQREGYGGVGFAAELYNGRHRIKTLESHGPASRAGVRPGEFVLAIDGEAVAALPARAVEERLRGPIGSLVLITLGADNDSSRRLALRRERVIPNTVTLAIDPPVAILRIERFNAATTTNLREAVRTARRVLGVRTQGFVLDLRGNPGGLLDQAVSVADLFVAHGRLISTDGRHPDSHQRFDASHEDLLDGLPLVALLDGRSASAAEIVAAALQDTGRAVVVGASSFGKGSVQTVIRLPNEGEMFLTWSRLYAPSGYTLHRQGVLPTVCTSRDGNAELMLVALKEGRLWPPASAASMRASAPEDEKSLASLRETCPWKPHEADVDLKVAKQLVADRSLYQRALAWPQTTVAQR